MARSRKNSPGRGRIPAGLRSGASALMGLLLLAPASAAWAEEGQPTENSQGGGPAPSPGIESLLHLPSGFNGSSPRASVAGASESEWRRRFRRASQDLDDAREALEKTKVALDGAAESGGANQWSVAPPSGGGANAPNAGSPLSFKLRQELRQNRLDLDASKRALKELTIEADLAGVPGEWRGVEPGDTIRTPSEVGQLLD